VLYKVHCETISEKSGHASYLKSTQPISVVTNLLYIILVFDDRGLDDPADNSREPLVGLFKVTLVPMSGSATRPSGEGRVLSRGQGGGEDNRRGGSGAAEPDIEDEDSCNMTAVDPTSMLRSGDNADEILPPSNLHGSQLTQTGSSSVNRHQQDRKDSSKLIAIMNSMKKSEKKKFQLLLQQFTNSNDRLVSQ